MLTSFVFSGIQPDETGINNGLIIGIKMNMRAIILIMGFTVLGTELYNPVIRNFFHNSYFRQVSMSLELSLESLPSMISQMPDLKSIVKNPVIIISQIILQAEKHLDEINFIKTKVFILSGQIGQGKTKLIQKLTEKLKSEGKSVGGILSPKISEEGEIVGYDICDISNGKQIPFLRISSGSQQNTIGRFDILQQGMVFGNEALEKSAALPHDLIIIDEVGRLELQNSGWANSIEKLLISKRNPILMVVRDEFINDIIDKWNITPVEIFNVSDNKIFLISTYLEKLYPKKR
jgi:nucleoside-triphosphatase THEP1